MSEITRRSLIASSLRCAALTETSLLSSLLGLHLTRTAVAATAPSDYRALVCLFLTGGNDSFNMLVPLDGEAHESYRGVRGPLGLAPDALLPIGDADGGRCYGLHPGLGEVARLYGAGTLAFVANVGTLVEPITRADYERRTKLPMGLFSHNDQQRHWQTSMADSSSRLSGWAGRMADVLTDATGEDATTFMSVALERVNLMQTGRRVLPYVVEPRGGPEMPAGYGEDNAFDRVLTLTTDRLLRHPYGDLLERRYAQGRRQAIDATLAYERALAPVALRTEFPPTPLGARLRQVARTIAASGALGHRRQIFFVEHVGWDHHDSLLVRQQALFPELSQALGAFYDATVELGVADSVVSFTVSDFGRTLSSNGNGTDHAWGGNQMVMGGSVAGGRVYGAYPLSLALGNELDVGRGVLLPTTSVDEYYAELAMWFGLANDATLELVLPNLRNFYPARATAPPIGWSRARPGAQRGGGLRASASA